MGQRHQIFVIAQVNTKPGRPPLYRCIVALHHQWCYGKTPLYGVNAFKRLARRKDNAFLIQAELDSYADNVEKLGVAYPCPYTTFLVLSAFSTDLSNEKAYMTRCVWAEEATMGIGAGDNNDGVTVLDVTMPENPEYCFVSLGVLEAAVFDVPCMTPLTATEYLRAYEPVPDSGDDEVENEALNLKAIADLDDMPVICFEVLEYVWEMREGTRFISYYSDDEDTDEAHEPGTPQRPLNAEEVSQLVAEAISQPSAQLGDLLRLDVSGNTAVDKGVFVQILKAHKPLKRINLYNCPISVDDFKDILDNQPELFHRLEVVLHPAFVADVKGKGNGWLNAFGTTVVVPDTFQKCRSVSLPFFTTDQVVQNVTDLLEYYSGEKRSERCYQDPGHTNLAAILACPTRDHDQDWRDRDVPMAPEFAAKPFQGRGGYNFVFVFPRGLTEPLQYAIIRFKKLEEGYGAVPEAKAGEKTLREPMDIMDMATFLKELEEVDGRPPPTNADAAKHLIDLCATMMTVLTDVEICF